jgi:hypothetical protein
LRVNKAIHAIRLHAEVLTLRRGGRIRGEVLCAPALQRVLNGRRVPCAVPRERSPFAGCCPTTLVAQRDLVVGLVRDCFCGLGRYCSVDSLLKESPAQRDAIELAEFNCVIYCSLETGSAWKQDLMLELRLAETNHRRNVLSVLASPVRGE